MAKQQQGTAVAPTRDVSGQLPAEIAELARGDAGKGVSSRQEDNLVPLIYVMQSNSPQVGKRNPEYIEGAEPGSIWLRNMPDPIVSGEDGLDFQPCFFKKDFVEWVPRAQGGGFVARHDELPEDAERVQDPANPNRVVYHRPNGNEVIETRNHMGYVYGHGPAPLPFVIPLTGTGHTFSRHWTTQMNLKTVGDGVAPSWAYVYRLRTRHMSNAKGEWFQLEVAGSRPVASTEDYLRGRKLHEAFASGEKRADAPAQRDDGDAAERAGL